MKDVLILVLTSKDITVLQECVKSCCTQNNTTLSAEVRVICNSTNADYVKSVQNLFGDGAIVTESNGRPGKGHNACIEYFYSVRDKYKYMLMVDGDDFLYPTALHEVEEVLKAKPETDVLFLQTNDKLVRMPPGITDKGYLRDNIYLMSFLSNQDHLWKTHKVELLNPFDNIAENLRTPGRGFMWSSALFDKIDFKNKGMKFYSEECLLFDDLYAFLVTWHLRNEGRLNVEYTVSSFIYLYNEFNTQSTSRTLDGKAHAPDTVIAQTWREQFSEIANFWDVESLIPVSIPLMDSKFMDGKTDFEYKASYSMNILNRLLGEYKRKAAALLAELRPLLTMLEL